MTPCCVQVPSGSRVHGHHPGRAHSESPLPARPVRVRAERRSGEQEPAAPHQRDGALQRRQEVSRQSNEGPQLEAVEGHLHGAVSRIPSDDLETFNFLENAEDSDEDEEADLMDDLGTDKHHRAKKHKTKVRFKPGPLLLQNSSVPLTPLLLVPPGGERGFGHRGRSRHGGGHEGV